MRYFPGVPWDAWEDMPYQLVVDCLDYIDVLMGGGGGGEGPGA